MLLGWKRMLSFALAIVFALSVWPLSDVRAETATAAYGKVTEDKVYLRKEPDKKSEYWFQMNTNHVAEILGTVTKNDVVWYHVQSENPASDGGHTYIGYVMAEFFRPLTADETQLWLTTHSLDANATVPPSGTATPVPGMTGNRLGEITAGETNFRVAAGMSGGIIAKLDRGTIVELLSIPLTTTSSDWYRVRYDGREGYVNAPYIRVLEVGTSGDLTGLTIYGYVQLTETSANLRLTPNGDVDVQWTVKGEVLPYVSAPRQDTANVNWRWYEVVYGGKRLWVRSDCVKRVAGGQSSTVTDSPATNPPATVTTPPAASSGYVVTTQDRVLLRLQPFGEKITRVEKKGTVLPYELVVQPYTTGNNSKYTWYYVTATENGSAVKGYVRSDCVEITTGPAEQTVPPTVTDSPAPPTTPVTAPPVDFGYVKMVKTDVALRQTPGGAKLERLALGTVVPVTGATLQASSYTWYPVRAASGNAGFVRGDCVAVCDAAGNIGGTATQSPATVTPSVPTNTPGSSYTGYGYVQIILDKTNIRSSMNGSRILQIPTKGGIYPLWGNPGSKGGYNWYPILIDGQQGWVRSDCVRQLTPEQVDAYLNGQTLPTDQPTQAPVSAYLITVLDNVNLRDSASKDSNASFNVAIGTVMAYNGTSGSGNNLWYRVVYRNKEVWVLSTCVRVMTQQEYQDWQAQHPYDEPQTEITLGYVKTTANKVNLRDRADGERIGQIANTGTVLPYTATQVVRNTTWYYVKLSDGTRGWITGDYVTLTDASGNSTTTTPPSGTTTTPAPGSYVPPTAGQEASYTTLSYGDTGDAVTRLVTELKLQGYYTGEITSRYSSAVRDAVKALQQAKGLTVDGIANSATQHALFQTVPVGSSGSSGGLDFPLYPVEKIDWFTGGIQELWPKGANAKVYDVRTGIVWWAHRWSGFNHADVEPLTAADTARLCKILGVTTMDVVTDKSADGFWRKRPSVVQIGTRNFAASLYAVPHNPEGDTIPNNNMTGQVCIHFTNSKTSGTNVVSPEHVEAIEYAYNNFPGGHK